MIENRNLNYLDPDNNEGAEPKRADTEHNNNQQRKPSHCKIEEEKSKDGIIAAQFDQIFHKR